MTNLIYTHTHTYTYIQCPVMDCSATSVLRLKIKQHLLEENAKTKVPEQSFPLDFSVFVASLPCVFLSTGLLWGVLRRCNQ